MDEVETNISMARNQGQMAAAIRGTEQALKLSGLLTEHPQYEPVRITSVTVVLNPREGSTTTESRQIVDGTSRMLNPSEKEPST